MGTDGSRHGDPVFGGPAVSFAEAFPEVADFRMEVEERTVGGGQPLRKYTYSMQHLPPGRYLACSNPVCRRGGLPVIYVLQDAVRAKETEREESVSCVGVEGIGEGK